MLREQNRRLRNPENFCLCTPGSRALKSGILLTIGIWDSSSTDKDPEFTAWNPESNTLFHFTSHEANELKLQVYDKGQTSDSSWEFLKIENK